ncbi:serine hydrolase [Corynebacterium sp. 13CS0277]|uniref:serine hydrolase domain-containing protein n=1 Tax=Corynebacterium sp. 13CS0277 TaxID=2071994 RepID=UPI001304DB9D|nr:serine hydrolase domain-containing protein [Corynebacterium sp. 13CS0277]
MGVTVLGVGLLFRPQQPTLADLEGLAGTRGAIISLAGDTLDIRTAGTQSTSALKSSESAQPEGACVDAFEVGSISKAMTGLVLADALERGELHLDTPIPDHPGLTLRDVVTHHSGLPRSGSGLKHTARLMLSSITGANPYDPTPGALAQQLAELDLNEVQPGTFRYSNLGAASTGALFPRYLGGDYATVMQQRLFAPLGMHDTFVQTLDHTVCPGFSGAGLAQDPWVMGDYSPAGGIVSTPEDMGRLLRALLAGTAPGMSALEPLAPSTPGEQIGMFWMLTPQHTAADSHTAPTPLAWHDGATAGYGSYLGIDRTRGRGVVVLSNSPADHTARGEKLLREGHSS